MYICALAFLCFSVCSSAVLILGFPAGHNAALSKALEMARELRKMGEERALVLYKAGILTIFDSDVVSLK